MTKTLSSPQPYSPPLGTKYVWRPGGLRHLPRTSRVVPFPEDTGICAQLRVYAYSAGTYRGNAVFFDWRNNYVTLHTPFLKNELSAFLKTEALVDRWIASFPGWMPAALAAGWRCPVFKRRAGLADGVLDLDKGPI